MNYNVTAYIDERLGGEKASSALLVFTCLHIEQDSVSGRQPCIEAITYRGTESCA